MYFATSLPLATVPTQIVQEFEELNAAQHTAPLRLLALIDCAFDEAFLNARYPRTSPPRSLYANTALQDFGAAGLHLLTSPEGEAEPLGWLSHLFSASGNKPMLSIVASPMTTDEFANHMRPYLIATTSDTMEWPVRWGDTRVLPSLLQTLSKSQHSHFIAPIARWWWPGRDGRVLRCDGPARLSGRNDFDKLPVSDESFEKLVDMAEADAVLANLYDSQPDLFKTVDPAKLHACVAWHLRVASANAIHAAPARQHFSALALILSDKFTQQPAMVELFRKTRQGAEYFSEIAELPDEFWRATER